jgi:hypothetical protein
MACMDGSITVNTGITKKMHACMHAWTPTPLWIIMSHDLDQPIEYKHKKRGQ